MSAARRPSSARSLSVAAAYLAMRFNNIMDMLQLIFSFVNAPLFATFLLGMFWRRTTGHGAFWGLVAGTLAASLHYEVTAVVGGGSLIPKLAVVHEYASDMAQNFWGAIWAWTVCFVVTIAISVATSAEARRAVEGPRVRPDAAPVRRGPAVASSSRARSPSSSSSCCAGLNVIFW